MTHLALAHILTFYSALEHIECLSGPRGSLFLLPFVIGSCTSIDFCRYTASFFYTAWLLSSRTRLTAQEWHYSIRSPDGQPYRPRSCFPTRQLTGALFTFRSCSTCPYTPDGKYSVKWLHILLLCFKTQGFRVIVMKKDKTPSQVIQEPKSRYIRA